MATVVRANAKIPQLNGTKQLVSGVVRANAKIHILKQFTTPRFNVCQQPSCTC